MSEALGDNVAREQHETSVGAVGYILKGYPRLSEPFIANEIHLLERMGVRLALFSIKQGDAGEPHDVVRRISAPLRYAPKVPPVSDCTLRAWLRSNLAKFVPAHKAVLRRRPGRYLSTFAAAWACTGDIASVRSVSPRKPSSRSFCRRVTSPTRCSRTAASRTFTGTSATRRRR